MQKLPISIRIESAPAACENHGCGCSHSAEPAPVPADVLADTPGAALFFIADMDCAAEESDIRRALDPVAGIQSLRFHLSSRTLAITAGPEVLPLALNAIRQAGFVPEPVQAHTAGQPHPAHAVGQVWPRLIGRASCRERVLTDV